jgi:hypothetical protein
MSASGLVVFGTTIGLLSALSSAAGTTSALIGLLFALVGGSILTWFDKNKVADANLPMLTKSAGWIGGGILLGVLLGISLRWLDQRYIEPDIAQHRLEAEAEALAPTLAKMDALMAKANAANKSSSETNKAIARQLETLKTSLEALPKASKPDSVVELHGIRSDDLDRLASLLHRDLEAMKPNDPEYKKVSDLEAAVNAIIALKREKDLRVAYPKLKDDTIDQLREVTK